IDRGQISKVAELLCAVADESSSHQERNSAFFGPFGPGRERTVLILSKRARLRTDDAVRLSSIPIAAVLSPAAAIDRSKRSSSGVHEALISPSPSAPIGWDRSGRRLRHGLWFRRGYRAPKLWP